MMPHLLPSLLLLLCPLPPFVPASLPPLPAAASAVATALALTAVTLGEGELTPAVLVARGESPPSLLAALGETVRIPDNSRCSACMCRQQHVCVRRDTVDIYDKAVVVLQGPREQHWHRQRQGRRRWGEEAKGEKLDQRASHPCHLRIGLFLLLFRCQRTARRRLSRQQAGERFCYIPTSFPQCCQYLCERAARPPSHINPIRYRYVRIRKSRRYVRFTVWEVVAESSSTCFSSTAIPYRTDSCRWTSSSASLKVCHSLASPKELSGSQLFAVAG